MTRTPAAHADICAVIVTYGDRATLCLQVVDGALASGAAHVVLVDNGSTPTSEAALSARAGDPRVTRVRLDRNTGSAVGFASGRTAALARPETGRIWFLDDDNLPAPEMLSALLEHEGRLSALHGTTDLAVLAFRKDRDEQQALMVGLPWPQVFPPAHAFLSFDLLRRIMRHRHQRPMLGSAVGAVEIPYGPYGGMLISRAALTRTDGPNEDYVLYEDDTEFTHRLHRAHVRLFLVEAGDLSDLDASWYATAAGGTAWTRLLSAQSDRRVYYSIRNRLHFENTVWSGRRRRGLRRRLNRFVYVTGLEIAARLLKRRPRLALIHRALRDGDDATLGERPELAL